MAHVQTKYGELWKPQDLSIDKISSQKMFIDNINIIEEFMLSTLQSVRRSVPTVVELRAIDTTDEILFRSGVMVIVQNKGLYSLNRGHSGDDDSNMIIKPHVGVGRWIAVAIRDIFPHSTQVNTIEELDIYLEEMISNMSIVSVRHIVINATTPFEPFGGGTIHMTIYKTSNNYASIEARLYSPDAIWQFTRSKYQGVWKNWYKLPYLDENGKIPSDQVSAAASSTFIGETTVE